MASRASIGRVARTALTQQHRYSNLAAFKVPEIKNEPNQHYAKGSPEREQLAAAIQKFKANSPVKVPNVITGKWTQEASSPIITQSDPSSHDFKVAQYANSSAQEVKQAIERALEAKPAWESLPFADRAAVFLKAADLISTKYRYDIMAATMVGQGKNAWQAEIDAAAELADFFRFSVRYAEELYSQQPPFNSPGVWNRVEYRALEGFVYAVSPFNFTAIGGNLVGAPALMGNVVLWKPSPSAVAANYLIYQILLKSGLPEDVIQFCPGDAEEVTGAVLSHPEFASLHFTGSTAVFRKLYGQIAQGVAEGRYRGYPRIVGETGGKNFHLIHASADIDNAVNNTVRGAFEYQGQKCSATSRLYVAKSIWPEFKAKLVEETEKLKVGAIDEFSNFVGPVIHEAAFQKLSKAIDGAKNDTGLELLTGGKYDGSKGFFIHPTIYEAKEASHPFFTTEFFGPILTTYVYDDASPTAFDEICKTVDSTGGYGLTGSVFATDRSVISHAEQLLRNSAGNFYINCKSTGAVVGQQPFGGARASGTNDKAGSLSLLSRFVSPRSLKEEYLPITSVEYPSNR